MTGTEQSPPAGGPAPDPHLLAHPQEGFALLRSVAPVMAIDNPGVGTSATMVLVGGEKEVREVLKQTDLYSSGIDAVHIGQIRPLIPLQIDPPDQKKYRKLLDPLFAPRQVATLEERTRSLMRGLIAGVIDQGGCNFHTAIAEPLPTTVFLELLGLPVSRRKEFIELKDGIIRPNASTPEQRREMVDATGAKIYQVLEEVLVEREREPQNDFMSEFVRAEVDGQTLTHNEVLDICYLFFLGGLDTVTASLDCFLAYLAQHPDARRSIVDEPSLIPSAIEEMLRWETPVTGIIRITTGDTELGGCPIAKGTSVSLLLGSANTDDAAWPDSDIIDFRRKTNKHLAFGGGPHRCLGSHLARMELRVAIEEWHAAVPQYSIPAGIELLYSEGLRSVDNLELIW
jgi:cytochrome P450